MINEEPPHKRDMSMVFQSYAIFPAPERLREHGLWPERAAAAQGRDPGAGGAGAGTGRTDRPGEPRAQPAFRRAAAARGAGPRAGHGAQGAADGRAALQPRRQAARADAHRDPAHPEATGHHQRLRHPRPGRGHDPLRPDRGDERGQDRADRHAHRDLSPAPDPLCGRLHRAGQLCRGHRARATGWAPGRSTRWAQR